MLCRDIKMRADIKVCVESCITDWLANELPGKKKMRVVCRWEKPMINLYVQWVILS